MTSLPRSTPEEQGVSSAALLDLLERLDASHLELHSLMVVRHGHVIAEGWWSPYRAELPHQLYSVSKSFTSMAVGLVVAEGKLSVDDQVISFFPDHLPADLSDNLAAMRVRHLLTMTTGHAEEPPTLRGRTDSWLKAFFAVPVEKEPGTHFVYNTPATYVLSAIVQQLTGETVMDYLRPRLFDPLGMTEATWPASPEGITLGGFGLSLTTESLARFGQFLLDQGRYDGRQLVPADWVAAATSRQVPNDNQDNPDWKQGYGYQFWRSRHGYRADGAFCQFCLVFPEADGYVVTTAATTDMQDLLDIIWATVPDALMGEAPLPADEQAAEGLHTRLAQLDLPAPPGSGATPPQLAGRTYAIETMAGNGLSRLTFGPDGVTARLGVDGRSADVVCGQGEWRVQSTDLGWDHGEVAASGVWDGDRYVLTVRFIGTPFCYTFACRFDGDRAEVDGSVNVVIGLMQQSFQQTGRLAQ